LLLRRQPKLSRLKAGLCGKLLCGQTKLTCGLPRANSKLRLRLTKLASLLCGLKCSACPSLTKLAGKTRRL
jgi:hypothetical protein